VPLYTHVQDQSQPFTIEDMVAAAKRTLTEGYNAIKTDPFKSQREMGTEFQGASRVERLDPKALAEAVDWMDALRETVGPECELMVDAHGRFDVASAIAAARALEHVNLIWYEEPTHIESNEALRQVRENINIPLCIGERHFTRWDYVFVLENRLVDYVMPDVAWCGGISELRRIAAMAEPRYIRVSPHDALGPVAIAASFQLCMNIPNLYREECIHTWFPDFEKIITPMFDVRDGCMHPSGKPGLGIELIREEVERYSVDPHSSEAMPDWTHPNKGANARWYTVETA
jgi:galactonate dehydratase